MSYGTAMIRYAPKKLTIDEILAIIQGYGVNNDSLTVDCIEHENENPWAIKINVSRPTELMLDAIVGGGWKVKTQEYYCEKCGLESHIYHREDDDMLTVVRLIEENHNKWSPECTQPTTMLRVINENKSVK